MSDTHNIEEQDKISNSGREWLYVGDWSPGPIKPYTSKRDGDIRNANVTLNPIDIFIGLEGKRKKKA